MKFIRVLFAVSFLMMMAARCAAAEDAASLAGKTGSSTAEPEKSPWGWLALPKVTMPKISMPKIEMPKMPADPLAPVKSSAKKVSEGASKAWEGTKEMFTFGAPKADAHTQSAHTQSSAAQPKSPSLWQKMFGGEKKQEPEGPRTVSEWMAQPRLDP